MYELYEDCRLCPRGCAVDRAEGQRGFCGQGARTRVAWAGLHFGEEPLLGGKDGSGAIFFSGCTLKCAGCQNHQISRRGLGRELSPPGLSELMLELQKRGAQNINLVTATQFAPAVCAAVDRARRRGLDLPVLWNSSGYERAATLELLQETVDVYLPDCKTLDSELARRLMSAADYPQVAQEALLRMADSRPLLVKNGRICRGVIVRHLVLPGFLEQSRRVLEWFSRKLKDRALLSLMLQYTPPRRRSAAPDRPVSRREYRRLLGWLEELDIEDGYIQEPACGPDWLPDFTRRNPFPPGQAVTVWHFSQDPRTGKNRP
jgi:putative pyruvate formate lyase activating enzyme